jgi:hypothetical protein
LSNDNSSLHPPLILFSIICGKYKNKKNKKKNMKYTIIINYKDFLPIIYSFCSKICLDWFNFYAKPMTLYKLCLIKSCKIKYEENNLPIEINNDIKLIKNILYKKQETKNFIKHGTPNISKCIHPYFTP